MKATARRMTVALAAAWIAALALPAALPAQEPAPLMDYGVDVVSDYVFRGSDVYRDVHIARETGETPFNVAPAVQPSVTFYGPGGLSFNFWGSFALTDREAESEPNPATGDTFAGLSTLDEIDTTIAYAWDNRLGDFSAGIVNYALINPAPQGEQGATVQEMFFSWGLPFAAAAAPIWSYYQDSDTGAYYTSLAVSGGEALSWSGNLGVVSEGVQDVTVGLGYGFGAFSVSANAAYRPSPQLHGYTSDGEYTSQDDGTTADYPPAIFWLAIGYGGTVTE